MKKIFAVWSLSNHFKNKVFKSIKNNKNIKIKYILTKKNIGNKYFDNITFIKKKRKFKIF